MPLSASVFVAGHRGLVGSAVWRLLEQRGQERLIGRTSAELDLRDRDAVFRFFDKERPEYVVLAAAKVGGIVANSTYPADFISDNLLVQVNVTDESAADAQLLESVTSGGGVTVSGFGRDKADLEDVFLKLVEGDSHSHGR